MSVSSCICYRTDFASLKAIADASGGGLQELHAATGCGSRCGLCIPYIRAMLLTGLVELPPMLPNDFKKLGIRCSTLERLVTQLESRGEPVTHDAEAAARLTDSPNMQLDQSAQKA
jgi:bacterioferritin-associated ferredoxin